MTTRKPVLQKIASNRYIVRFGTQRIGEVIQSQSEEKWFYINRDGRIKEGYDTAEHAMEELTHELTKRLKKPSDYPRIHFCLSQERIDWFRDYALRQDKSMSAIIKDCIEELYQQDPEN